MFTPYTFPNWPNTDTRQQINTLNDAPRTEIDPYRSASGVAQNANANAYAPQGNIPIPGSQVFGLDNGYNVMPGLINQDTVHRQINLVIDSGLLYRSNPGVPRQEARDYRLRTTTVNAPPATTARFSDGTRGDVYGA